MLRNRKGFTLIELLIVVVIIGILAAIAIPKFAATKDKAKLASVKSDLKQLMTAQEAYFSDFNAYGTVAQLEAAKLWTKSPGNTATTTVAASGYDATASNSTISSSTTGCKVKVGQGATNDGDITCP